MTGSHTNPFAVSEQILSGFISWPLPIKTRTLCSLALFVATLGGNKHKRGSLNEGETLCMVDAAANTSITLLILFIFDSKAACAPRQMIRDDWREDLQVFGGRSLRIFAIQKARQVGRQTGSAANCLVLAASAFSA